MSAEVKPRHSCHSKDFDEDFLRQITTGDRCRINNKTLDEWNEEHGLTGILAALKAMGWETWQWRWTHPDHVNPKLKELGGRGCFMEVFGQCYGGYIRTDAETLNECGVKALNTAQKYAQCEVRGGHEFAVPPAYKNGYHSCKKCGFGGFQPSYQLLSRHIEHLKLQCEMQKEQLVRTGQAIKDAGFRVMNNLFSDTEGTDSCCYSYRLEPDPKLPQKFKEVDATTI